MQSPDANEKTAKTSTGKSPNFHLRFNINTPTFDQRDIDESARSTGLTKHHYNSQLWRIQEENAEIQKTQVELLRRMTVPVPKPLVFDGNILENPKWENAFDALIEHQVVCPNYKLYYLGEYMWSSAKNDQRFVRIKDRRRLQVSKKNAEGMLWRTL